MGRVSLIPRPMHAFLLSMTSVPSRRKAYMGLDTRLGEPCTYTSIPHVRVCMHLH